MERLVGSPCSAPDWTLPEVLSAHADLGFLKLEAFVSWVKSALDPTADPILYVDLAGRYGMRYTSMHLPPVGDDLEGSVTRAVRAARFARALGAEVVLFKAASRRNYIRAAPVFLDATEGLGLTAVIQNHCGSPLHDVDDVLEVLDGVGDERLKVLLEVGHFHQAGIAWNEAYEPLRQRVALVHIKDIAAGKPVPFGLGEVDFPSLASTLEADGYEGDYVVELEGEECRADPLRYLREAVDYLLPLIEE
jgi:sugar phosphate isomerase/epimerase